MIHQLHSREEYLDLIDDIVDVGGSWILADPFAVANTMVATAEFVEPENGYTRTHGTNEIDDRTLYPMDVVAYSEQPIEQVDEFGDLDHESKRAIDIYAVCTMALDIKDRAEE